MRVEITAVGLCLVALAGCGEESERVPAACRQGSATVAAALRDAPGTVRLEGTAKISDCIKDTSTSGELSDVGTAFVTVAQKLADDAATDPDGKAATQLGYLVGAVERSRYGAQGVGYELERRLDQELLRIDTRSDAYRRGLRAGRETG